MPSLAAAANAGDIEQIQRLLAAGHPVDKVDAEGRTALWCAVRAGHAAAVAALLDAGADELGHAAMLTAYIWSWPTATARGTLLHDAAYANHPEVIELLLDRGFDIEARDEDRTTPLGLACYAGSLGAARALLARGADANAADRGGRTPLDYASTTELITALLKRGASPHPTPDSRYTHLGRWVILGNEGAVAALLDAGASPDALHDGRSPLGWAITSGQPRILARLLKAGASVDSIGSEPSPLQLAAQAGDIAVFDQLLARKPKDLGAALHAAAGSGHEPIVEKLLAAGAPVDHVSRRHTPLQRAAMGGHAGVIRRLLKAGAKIEAKNKDGETALFLAAASPEGAGAVTALLDGGADVNARNRQGTILYDAVRSSASLGALAILRDRGAITRDKAPPDPPPAAPSGPTVGSRVKHPKFGEGTITAINGLGDDQKYTISFDTGGSKVLLARFLTPIP